MARDTDCMPPSPRLSRMKSWSTRFSKDPAEAAMRSACSREDVCEGLVSMPEAM